jgi:hypothetical protein
MSWLEMLLPRQKREDEATKQDLKAKEEVHQRHHNKNITNLVDECNSSNEACTTKTGSTKHQPLRWWRSWKKSEATASLTSHTTVSFSMEEWMQEFQKSPRKKKVVNGTRPSHGNALWKGSEWGPILSTIPHCNEGQQQRDRCDSG